MASDIVTLPAPVLRKKAPLVTREEFGSKELTHIIRNMSSALRKTPDGIGIAAPQIGISKQIFLASEEALAIDEGWEPKDAADERAKKKTWQYIIFINPTVMKVSSKKIPGSEGCLSVPKTYGIVPRAEKIRVRAYDEHGKVFERGASKLFARLLQHEIDHLGGTLFIDHATKITKIADKK
ncbi:MAG: peptide deformylase [Patescibacteria group bacterium]